MGLPCDGCEYVFVGLPDELGSSERIAPVEEPGEPLRILGTVRTPQGQPAPGIIVYGYHTDASGLYPPDTPPPGRAAVRHGRLRGWARTDAEGRYQFDTIRPGAYPEGGNPQHVHLHVLEPGRCTYYIDDLVFDDDPLLTDEVRSTTNRGGPGIATPTRDAAGTWIAHRDITLGAAIPGYPGR